MSTFGADIADWARRVKEAQTAIFRESVEELVRVMDLLLVESVYDRPPSASGYRRTGFLRASLVASTTAMPLATRDNPGASAPPDMGDVILVIAGADIGETVYLGMTARYAPMVHYGVNGQPGRPWVDMAAQRWPAIVASVSEAVKQRMGL